MQNSSPKYLALILSLSIAAISLIFMLLIYFFNHIDYSWLIVVFSVLAVFIFTFVILFVTLKSYIVNKLKPIYQTIDRLKNSEKKHKDNIDNNNIIAEVNEEVVNWARKKTKEIAILKANERYRKEFIGNVSHELKTPLFNIQGYLLTLIDGGLYDPEINMKYLSRTERNLNRLITIVKDLEAITKLESGELKLNIERFNIVNSTQEVLDFHEMRANERNIQLKLKKTKGQIFVEADKTRIFEVISNLVINSIIYGKKDGTTTVKISDLDPKIFIEVCDNGIGIEQEEQNRIFERFYRVDKSRSTQLGGTGLGLSIVKHIMEAHGELITVRSKKNEGTIFSFTLKKSES